MDTGEAKQIAAARVKLALRAEQAFGSQAVQGVDLQSVVAAASTPARAAAEPKPGDADRKPAAVKRKSPPASSSAKAAPAKPKTDLFGNPIATSAPAAGDGDVFTEPPPEPKKRIELLQALNEQEVSGCTQCELHTTRTQTVFGEGNPEAKLMFIGEGPGQNEDETGRPFVGRAGQMLDKWIGAMGLQRQDVYIANVVKCRPPNNRVPTAVEVSTCTPYLHKQLDWIRPQVIVTLGLPSTRHLLKLNLPMGKMRGKWHAWRGIKVMPTYHPAYLLRAHTPANRRIVWDDLQQVMAELGLEKS
ncbi:MAG: uracil-DNA glycosylase [Planctomycetota bacterium]